MCIRDRNRARLRLYSGAQLVGRLRFRFFRGYPLLSIQHPKNRPISGLWKRFLHQHSAKGPNSEAAIGSPGDQYYVPYKLFSACYGACADTRAKHQQHISQFMDSHIASDGYYRGIWSSCEYSSDNSKGCLLYTSGWVVGGLRVVGEGDGFGGGGVVVERVPNLFGEEGHEGREKAQSRLCLLYTSRCV